MTRQTTCWIIGGVILIVVMLLVGGLIYYNAKGAPHPTPGMKREMSVGEFPELIVTPDYPRCGYLGIAIANYHWAGSNAAAPWSLWAQVSFRTGERAPEFIPMVLCLDCTRNGPHYSQYVSKIPWSSFGIASGLSVNLSTVFGLSTVINWPKQDPNCKYSETNLCWVTCHWEE